MPMDKPSLRKQYLQRRKTLSSFDSFIKSWIIQDIIISSDFYCNAKIIGLYYPIINEVQTFRLMDDSLLNSKTVCLPVVVNDKLIFYRYNSRKELKMGKYSIMEPKSTDIEMNNLLDLIIVPGIVFDNVGNRIGYGKGYYDRLFASIPSDGLTIAGLGYNFQVHPEELEHFEHDAKMDILVTEVGLKFF